MEKLKVGHFWKLLSSIRLYLKDLPHTHSLYHSKLYLFYWCLVREVKERIMEFNQQNYLEDEPLLTSIWQRELDFAIKSSWTQQGRIQCVSSVSCHDNLYIYCLVKSIHLQDKALKLQSIKAIKFDNVRGVGYEGSVVDLLCLHIHYFFLLM